MRRPPDGTGGWESCRASRRLDASRRLRVRVGAGSAMRVLKNTYSVHSRLIGEEVTVRVRAEEIEVWYGQRQVDRLPRLRGVGKHRIDYRHVISWLVRKPGAFANYRYRDELFPTSRFRQAYDWLQAASPLQAAREYLQILEQAALGSEERVDAALQQLLAAEQPLSAEAVATVVDGAEGPATITDVHIAAVNLESYDGLLGAVVRGGREEARCVAAEI